jgi:hypothetical protein
LKSLTLLQTIPTAKLELFDDRIAFAIKTFVEENVSFIQYVCFFSLSLSLFHSFLIFVLSFSSSSVDEWKMIASFLHPLSISQVSRSSLQFSSPLISNSFRLKAISTILYRYVPQQQQQQQLQQQLQSVTQSSSSSSSFATHSSSSTTLLPTTDSPNYVNQGAQCFVTVENFEIVLQLLSEFGTHEESPLKVNIHAINLLYQLFTLIPYILRNSQLQSSQG